MGRPPRLDEPGRWFHVMNRGIAKRTVFETRADIRFFLSRVARAVRRDELEVHAYSILTTHFHLLVRSPRGRMSEGMRRVQNEYVRFFNRSRGRDGPLFRGRFTSRYVRSITYQQILVRYIDANPVEAGLVDVPWKYPWGSASHFAKGRWPTWLDGSWVMAAVEEMRNWNPDADYVSEWCWGLHEAERKLVEERNRAPATLEDGLDDLLGSSPEHVQRWMVEQARLADATKPGVVLVPESAVIACVEAARQEGAWNYRTEGGQRRCAWGVATAGLLRQLSGLTYQRLSAVMELGHSAVVRRVRTHRSLCGSSSSYARRLADVATVCLGLLSGARERRARGVGRASREVGPDTV